MSIDIFEKTNNRMIIFVLHIFYIMEADWIMSLNTIVTICNNLISTIVPNKTVR